ncbi:hypothetical protein LP416_25880 [Polaromonas sp. P2-4]|nr:hypothetical protein LP416_25880 [Polaromonas sp. P2-4]
MTLPMPGKTPPRKLGTGFALALLRAGLPSKSPVTITLLPSRSTLPPVFPSVPMVIDLAGRPGKVSLYFPAGSPVNW